jgi:hypothetical protein
MADYASSSDCFADIIDSSYSSSDYPQMAAFVTAASRLIDLEMGRQAGFFIGSTDQVMYYDGSGLDCQEIDEFVSISAVAVSEQGDLSSTSYTAWTTNDYLTWPYNATAKGKPITKLLINDDGDKVAFYGYRKAVKVTGSLGYSSTVPDVIKQACKIQAVRMFMRAKQGYQDAGAGGDALAIKGQAMLDPDVKALLYPIKLELS